jgi:hypothetical protein
MSEPSGSEVKELGEPRSGWCNRIALLRADEENGYCEASAKVARVLPSS